jgi:hypothetical protein
VTQKEAGKDMAEEPKHVIHVPAWGYERPPDWESYAPEFTHDRSQQLSEEALSQAVNKGCAYLTDEPWFTNYGDPEWVPVYLVKFDPGRRCVEVIPAPGTDYARYRSIITGTDETHAEPIRITDYSRVFILPEPA